MPRTVCRRCDNAGVIFVKRQRKKKERRPDGSEVEVPVTEEVEETCPTCKGQGWVDQGGG